MIRRLFYFSLGALAAVWTMRRLRTLSPEHVARRALTSAAGTAVSLREFAAQVRREAAVRESELRAQYGLTSLEGPDPGHGPGGGPTPPPAGPHRPDEPGITVTRVASASRRARAALPAGPGEHRQHHRRQHHRHDEKDGR